MNSSYTDQRQRVALTRRTVHVQSPEGLTHGQWGGSTLA